MIVGARVRGWPRRGGKGGADASIKKITFFSRKIQHLAESARSTREKRGKAPTTALVCSPNNHMDGESTRGVFKKAYTSCATRVKETAKRRNRVAKKVSDQGLFLSCVSTQQPGKSGKSTGQGDYGGRGRVGQANGEVEPRTF